MKIEAKTRLVASDPYIKGPVEEVLSNGQRVPHKNAKMLQSMRYNDSDLKTFTRLGQYGVAWGPHQMSVAKLYTPESRLDFGKESWPEQDRLIKQILSEAKRQGHPMLKELEAEAKIEIANRKS
jgi:hypothetical protein